MPTLANRLLLTAANLTSKTWPVAARLFPETLEIDSVGHDRRGDADAGQPILGVLAVGKHLARTAKNLALDPSQRALEKAVATG